MRVTFKIPAYASFYGNFSEPEVADAIDQFQTLTRPMAGEGSREFEYIREGQEGFAYDEKTTASFQQLPEELRGPEEIKLMCLLRKELDGYLNTIRGFLRKGAGPSSNN